MQKRSSKKSSYLIPDGIVRTNEAEYKINECLMLAFSERAGLDALAYLRSISVEHVVGPHNPQMLSHESLAFQAGMRFMTYLIEERIRLGQSKLPKLNDPLSMET